MVYLPTRRRAITAISAAALSGLFPATGYGYAGATPRPLSLSDSWEFMHDSLHEASPAEALTIRCGDDRYQQGGGAIATFGGDAGFCGIALAGAIRLRQEGVVLAPAQVLGAALTVIGGAAQICWHTDAEAGKFGWGCAHCRLLMREPSLYGLDVFSRDALRHMLLHPVTARPVILEGVHAASGVFVVSQERVNDGRVFALDARGRVAGEERRALVYQPTLEARRLDTLAIEFCRRCPIESMPRLEIVMDTLRQVAREHFEQTLSSLAQGVPRFNVIIDADGTYDVHAA